MYSDLEKKKSSLGSIFAKIFHRRTKRLLTDTEKLFQSYLDSFTVYTIIFIIVGIFCAVLQNTSLTSWRFVYGILFLISGVIQYLFFLKRRQFYFYRFSWIYAICYVVLGMISFFLDLYHIHLLLLLFAVFIFISSFEHLVEWGVLFPLHDVSVLLLFVHIILAVVIGIFVIVNPFAHLSFTEILGIFSILYGIINLSVLSLLQRRITEFVDRFS